MTTPQAIKDESVLVGKYINSSYDIVKAVYDNLANITAVAGFSDVTIQNNKDVLYLEGSEAVDGSLRFINDTETNAVMIERRESGLWQQYSFETSASTVWVGHNVGVAGVGHHLATESRDGHMHFSAQSEYNPTTGLTISDATILNSYYHAVRTIFQPDESGQWSGTEFEFNLASAGHILADNLYFKTGTIAPTAPVRIQIWEASYSGTKIFDRTYPHTIFTANTEIRLECHGVLEYEPNTQYYARHSSDNAFSWKTNAAGTEAWLAADYSLAKEDSLLQTSPYVDGDTYTLDQYLIKDRKIYVCNTAGVQTGTFESNAALWGEINSGSTLWKWEDDAIAPKDIASPVSIPNNLTVGSIAHINTIHSSNFELYDNTKNRLEIDSNLTKLFSPDGLTTLTQTNTGVALKGSNRTSTALSIVPFVWTASGDFARIALGDVNNYIQGEYSQGVRIGSNWGTQIYQDAVERAIVDGTKSRLWSPDQSHSLSVENAYVAIGGTLNVLSNTGQWKLENLDTGFVYSDWSQIRMMIDGTKNQLLSPDGSNKFTINDTGCVITGDLNANTIKTPVQGGSPYKGNLHLEMYGAELGTGISFESNQLSTAQTWAILASAGGANNNFRIYDSTVGIDRLNITVAGVLEITGNQLFKLANSKIYASDTNGYLAFGTGGDLSWYDVGNTTNRLNIIGTGSYLSSPTGIVALQITETGGYINISGAAAVQLEVSSLKSILRSPSGLESIEVNDTNVAVTGDLAVAGDITTVQDTNSYIQALRLVKDYSGGALLLEGAENGSSVKYTDFNLDNFWGYLRIYGGDSTNDTYTRILNVGTKDMNVMVDGGIMVGDGASYKTASAGIEIKSVTEALLLSRMTTTQKNALTALNGMVVYDTTLNAFYFYENGAWVTK